MFFYGVHHHPDFWEDPFSFKPKRFKTDHIEKINPGFYYPFGAGPRFCIGIGFAMAKMALFLQSFIHRFDITSTGHKPAMVPLITPRPDQVILNIAVK